MLENKRKTRQAGTDFVHLENREYALLQIAVGRYVDAVSGCLMDCRRASRDGWRESVEDMLWQRVVSACAFEIRRLMDSGKTVH